MQRKLLGITGVDFDTTGQLLTLCSTIIKYLRNTQEFDEAMHQLFIDVKKAYDSVRKEVFIIFFLSLVSPRNW
jgi:hypothetical protein